MLNISHPSYKGIPPLGDCILEESSGNLRNLHESFGSLSSTISRTCLKRPHVSFSAIVAVGTTIHLHEISEEEHAEYWVSSQEFEQQQRSADLASGLHEFFGHCSPANADDAVCIRGLESRTATAIATYSKLLLHALLAVLDEQEWQRSVGIVDEERIAAACRAVTYGSEQDAIVRAKEDELAVTSTQAKLS
jgi:hypothetical protein